jgi:hypothetical protein
MKFVKQSVIRATPEVVFSFHERPDAFRLLTPPWEKVEIVQTADISQIGSRAVIEMKVLGLFPARWVAEHTAYEPPRMFEDTQISGPFRKWVHRHIVEPHEEGSLLRDEIEFEMPLLSAFDRLAPLFVLPKLEKMFEYRHQITRNYCEGGTGEC